jgi:hypothetical protein
MLIIIHDSPINAATCLDEPLAGDRSDPYSAQEFNELERMQEQAELNRLRFKARRIRRVHIELL